MMPQIKSTASRCSTCFPWLDGSLLRRFLAEMIAVFILIFTVCGAIAVNVKENNAITILGVSAVVGLSLMATIYATLHVSGGHLNPAITISLAAVNSFPWKEVPVYVIGQNIGAILAAVALRLVLGKESYVAVSHHSGSIGQALSLEIILTFSVMFIALSIFDPRSVAGHLCGLIIGAFVALSVLFAGLVSGVSLNPARSFGPAVVANDYKQLWVYQVGPVIGGVLGAFAYKVIRLPEDPKVTNEISLQSVISDELKSIVRSPTRDPTTLSF